MLLSLMRKHAKSWLIKFLIAIIAIVFVFYFGYSFTSQRGIKVAEVNGEIVTGTEYQKTYRNLLERYQREYKNFWSDKLIETFDLKNKALEALIDQKLLSQEAKRIGMDITEKEIQDQILSYPAFQFRSGFDESRYRSLLLQNRMKPEDFEAMIAQDLLQQKLSQFLMAFSPVSDKEIEDHYRFLNKKIKVSFVQFMSDKYKETVISDQASMETYFNENRERYRVPEKIKVVYITIDYASFQKGITVSDSQIKDYYEFNKEKFQNAKQVRARHILFNLAPDATEETEKNVREKASAILAKAQSGEDFAELAKKYSEGPTAKKGGDLGFFPRGRMTKPFEDAAFKMKKGEISDLVRTNFGYHIIKVEDIKEAGIRALADIKGEIESLLIKNESMDRAHEKALSLIDQMPYDVDLIKYAEQNNVPASQSGYFSQDEPIPNIVDDPKLKNTLFSLALNDVSELIEMGDLLYVFQVVDKKASYLPEMAAVTERLKTDVVDYLAAHRVKSEAEEYLKKLKEGKDWDSLAKEYELSVESTDFFPRQAIPPKIGYMAGLQDAIFSLGEEKRYPDQVFENQTGAFLIRWEGSQGIDNQKYLEEKEKYRNSLIMVKQQIIFKGWLDNLKKQAEIDRSAFEKYK